MGDLLTGLATLVTAGTLLFSSSLDAAAPQNDVDGLLFLANRQWRVASTYVPEVRMTNVPGQVRRMRLDAADALEEMYEACKKETGVTLVDVSGYRSYGKQVKIWKNKLENVHGSKKKADEYVARPGASEHQLGLTMDVGQRGAKSNLAGSFGKTKGGIWLRNNSWRFGFILRYDQGWEEITGYNYEPWHFRYVGRENAKRITEAKVPLETWLLGWRAEILYDLVAIE